MSVQSKRRTTHKRSIRLCGYSSHKYKRVFRMFSNMIKCHDCKGFCLKDIPCVCKLKQAKSIK